jgi:hypothetical protein
LSPTEIALIQRSDWVKGEVVAHEYGHVVMMHAWDGNDGWGGVGNGGVSWNVTNPTEPRIAFKKGWANFISRAVFVEIRAYDAPAFDDNASTPLPGALGVGWQFVTNVNKLLSDWYDARADGGDHFTASLYSIWYNLRRMYLDAGAYGGDFQGGLTIYDYVNYYLDVRKSATAVGAPPRCEHWLGLSSLSSRPVPIESYATETASILYGAIPARPCRMNSIASSGSIVS